MTQQALTNLGLNNGWDTGASGWKAGMDNNLLLLDGLTEANVPTASLTTPPISPAAGDRYLVPPTGATGDWAGKDNQYTVWSGAANGTPAWVFVAPLAGWRMYVADKGKTFIYNGSSWIPALDRAALVPAAVLAISSGVVTLDASLGSAFDLTLTDNVATWAITAPVASPDVTRFTVRVRQDATGGWTLALPAGVLTPAGAGYVVSPAANAIDLLTFTSYDAGTSWYLESLQAFA